MSDHTPGPWHVIVGDNYTVRSEHTPNKYPHRFPGDDLGPIVALVGNRSADFGKSDARLIAAAPDLLEALRKFVAFHDMDSDVMTGVEVQTAYDQAIDAARTAIGKVNEK